MKTFKILSQIVFFSAILALAGCSSGAPEAAKTSDSGAAGAAGASGQNELKKYPMHGKVLSLDAAEKSARIDAGPIGDWMGAMTMNYPVKDASEFAKLTAGATIDATVFVQGDDFWVGEVRTAGAAAATGK